MPNKYYRIDAWTISLAKASFKIGCNVKVSQFLIVIGKSLKFALFILKYILVKISGHSKTRLDKPMPRGKQISPRLFKFALLIFLIATTVFWWHQMAYILHSTHLRHC